jgi:hypothetical protein
VSGCPACQWLGEIALVHDSEVVLNSLHALEQVPSKSLSVGVPCLEATASRSRARFSVVIPVKHRLPQTDRLPFTSVDGHTLTAGNRHHLPNPGSDGPHRRRTQVLVLSACLAGGKLWQPDARPLKMRRDWLVRALVDGQIASGRSSSLKCALGSPELRRIRTV